LADANNNIMIIWTALWAKRLAKLNPKVVRLTIPSHTKNLKSQKTWSKSVEQVA